MAEKFSAWARIKQGALPKAQRADATVSERNQELIDEVSAERGAPMLPADQEAAAQAKFQEYLKKQPGYK